MSKKRKKKGRWDVYKHLLKRKEESYGCSGKLRGETDGSKEFFLKRLFILLRLHCWQVRLRDEWEDHHHPGMAPEDKYKIRWQKLQRQSWTSDERVMTLIKADINPRQPHGLRKFASAVCHGKHSQIKLISEKPNTIVIESPEIYARAKLCTWCRPQRYNTAPEWCQYGFVASDIEMKRNRWPYLRGRKDMRSESFQYLFDLFFLFWFLRFFERHLKKEVEDENEWGREMG